ncbi:MAG: HD domain-containing protein, partial [Eggerthellaceae bacterium]|nr:HD domain-containing protein [Eggerthellaceae bacterium]
IYTALTKKALRIAYDAHQRQVDKTGDPYIFHPFHLAEQMQDEASTCAALLHDVVEDTDVTFADLEAEFPPEVVDALRLLTHEDGVPYLDYVRAIAANPIARAVKLADIAHNSDQTRFAGCDDVSDETLERLRSKYAAALEVLNA